jgi:hypothetical protein
LTPIGSSRSEVRKDFDERLHEALNIEWGLSREAIRAGEETDRLMADWGVGGE